MGVQVQAISYDMPDRPARLVQLWAETIAFCGEFEIDDDSFVRFELLDLEVNDADGRTVLGRLMTGEGFESIQAILHRNNVAVLISSYGLGGQSELATFDSFVQAASQSLIEVGFEPKITPADLLAE